MWMPLTMLPSARNSTKRQAVIVLWIVSQSKYYLLVLGLLLRKTENVCCESFVDPQCRPPPGLADDAGQPSSQYAYSAGHHQAGVLRGEEHPSAPRDVTASDHLQATAHLDAVHHVPRHWRCARRLRVVVGSGRAHVVARHLPLCHNARRPGHGLGDGHSAQIHYRLPDGLSHLQRAAPLDLGHRPLPQDQGGLYNRLCNAWQYSLALLHLGVDVNSVRDPVLW